MKQIKKVFAALRSAYSGRSGSVIIAVLVSAVFIGIVTTSMVKSVSTQGTTSAGYGSLIAMHSAANSANIVTESQFNKLSETAALDIVNAVAKGNSRPIVNEGGNRKKVSDGPFYMRSSLVNLDSTKTKNPPARFTIDVGRSANGKSIGTAHAFYNVMVEKIIVPPNPNAFYMGGNIDGNAKITVEGSATFEGLTNVNQGGMTFNAGPEGKGDVYFNRNFLSSIDALTFNVKAYFHENARIAANTTISPFKKDVGIRGHIDPANATLDFGTNNVWLGGGYRNLSLHSTIDGATDVNPAGAIKGTGLFHYTEGYNTNLGGVKAPGANKCVENFYGGHAPMPIPGSNCYTATESNKCAAHCLASQWHMTLNTGSEQKFKLVQYPVASLKYSTANPMSILGSSALNIDTVTVRRECDIILPLAGKSPVSLTAIIGAGGSVTATAIQNYITNNPKASNPNRYYNGHLLVNATGDGWLAANQTFNDSVIFIVPNDITMNVNTNFYQSGSNASTLIYVDKNGALSQMGTNGLFRGLIFVHEDNTKNQTFSWSGTSRIEGAVVLKGGTMTAWNTGGVNTTIRKNDEVLAAFQSLYDPACPLITAGGGSLGKDYKLAAGSTKVELKPMGYYFH